MTNEYQGATLGFDFAEQQFEEPVSIVGIERRGWLIGDQYLGAADQRTCDRDPLLLPNTEFGCRRVMECVVEIERPKQATSSLGDFYRGRRPVSFAARERGRDGDVLDHAQIGEQVELLEHNTDVVSPESIAPAGCQVGDIGSEQPDRTRGGYMDAGQQIEQGCFAAAARTSNKEVLAFVESQFIDRDDVGFLTRPPKGDLSKLDDRSICDLHLLEP